MASRRPAKKFWFIYNNFSLLKANLIEILNLDSTSFGTEICVSSFQNFMELFETQFYWKQFQKLLSGNPVFRNLTTRVLHCINYIIITSPTSLLFTLSSHIWIIMSGGSLPSIHSLHIHYRTSYMALEARLLV